MDPPYRFGIVKMKAEIFIITPGMVARLTKDVWSLVLSQLKSLSDFASAALVCRESLAASRIIRSKFADTFCHTVISYHARSVNIERLLKPSELLHGPRFDFIGRFPQWIGQQKPSYIRWYSFGKPLDVEPAIEAPTHDQYYNHPSLYYDNVLMAAWNNCNRST